jgi:hypothetical protein
MSTYVYLECLDHDPPLTSNGEVGQHLSDLPQVRKMIAQREAIVAIMRTDAPINYEHHFDSNTAWFLYRHPECNIGIVDEYDRRYPAVEECIDCETELDPKTAVRPFAAPHHEQALCPACADTRFEPDCHGR